MSTLIPSRQILALRAAAIARAAIKNGVHESDGPNRSPLIDSWTRAFGRYSHQDLLGASYCAIAQGVCYAQALGSLRGMVITEANMERVLPDLLTDVAAHYFTPSASCVLLMEDAEHRVLWRQHVHGADQHWLQQLRVGDLVLYEWGQGEHHVEMFLEAPLTTAGFNTSPEGGGGSQANGQGGYIRHRLPNIANVLGSVSINRVTQKYGFGMEGGGCSLIENPRPVGSLGETAS